jgi:hypothetical protein
MLNLYINPSEGGTIFELDYKPKSYNILNVLTRWEEAYHEKEKIAQEEIYIDTYRRAMFRTRFFSNDIGIEDLQANTYTERSNLLNTHYEVKTNRKEGHKAILGLRAIGSIDKKEDSNEFTCQLDKKIRVEKNEVRLSLKGELSAREGVSQEEKASIDDLSLGIDLPFFFNGNPRKFQWDSGEEEKDIPADNELQDTFIYEGSKFHAYDESYDLHFEIDIQSDKKSKIGCFPIVSFTYTDEGYKHILQGFNLIPVFRGIGDIFSIDLKIKIY